MCQGLRKKHRNRQIQEMVFYRFNKNGFTLLEIVMSLAILGFIMSLVVARFGGIPARALETTGKTNEARLTNFISAYIRDHGKYPGGLINIVSTDIASGKLLKPMVSDQDPDSGMEVISFESDSRCRFGIHYLNDAEAAELRGMGIGHLYNLNSRYDRNVADKAPSMEEVDAGTAVLMIGGGDSDDDGIIAAAEVNTSEEGWGENDLNFCMVFGLGNESDLVKNGYISNIAFCPLSTIALKDHAYKRYSIVIPRLKATSARLRKDNPYGMAKFKTFKLKTPLSADAASLALVTRREVDLYEFQPAWFFSILDSYGKRFHPLGGEGFWGVDFDGDGDVGI